MIKKICSVVLVAILAMNFSGCGSSKSNRYESQYLDIFDTVTQIVAYTDSKKQYDEYSKLIYDDLKEYHNLYDIYNNYDGINNIKTINDNAGVSPVKVDKKIIDLILFSKEEYDNTDGLMNIAFGSVLKIWHDYRTLGTENPEKAELPPLELLTEASKHTDINNIVIDEDNSTVFLTDSKMSIDVGSVGKGYATEQVCKLAEEKGLKNALISVGGNVRAIGNKGVDNKAWNVGIENPDKESDQKYVSVVNLDNMSLVTSGNYQRYYTVNGKSYHHIIDPKTLFPSEYFSSVTILSKDSAVADALSTAVFNMPIETGLDYINSIENTDAIWVLLDGQKVYSDRIQAYIEQ